MNRRAFSLVEMLIVSALVATISIAVANAFGNGLKLWQRADLLSHDAGVGIFLDQMAEDCRQVQLMKTLSFKGDSRQVELPTIVTLNADPKSTRANEGLIDSLGKVRYRYDDALHLIYRSRVNYGDAFYKRFSTEDIVIQSIESMSFKYYVITDKGLEEKDSVDGSVPYAMAISLTFKQDGVVSSIERFFPIPVGGAL